MGRNGMIATLLVAAVLAAPAAAAAEPKTFAVEKDGKSRATFLSEATLETIKGISSQLHGELSFDPDDPSNVSGKLQIPVRSMRTGIDLRDKHLRSEKWLNAKKHPNITFQITGVQGLSKLRPGKDLRFKIKGKISIHGVTKNITADARARYIPLTDKLRNKGIDGDMLRAKARFKIKLSDFNVSIPLPVKLKVSEEIQVSVDLRAIAR